MKLDGRAPHLIVFDVDGTLLDRRRQILASTRWSTQQLLGAGHHVALASARPPKSVERLSRDLLQNRAAYIISLNGAHITSEKGVLMERTIKRRAVLTSIRKARECGVQTNLFFGWDWLVDEITPQTRAEAEVVNFDPVEVEDLTLLNVPVHKLLFIAEPERIMRFRNLLRLSDLPVNASLSKPTYCEVIARQASKADAVAFLAQRLGVKAKNTVAFGDGENDLLMVTAAGTGVAMGNGIDAVKQVAKLITCTNDEDGIANALIRLGLVKKN